MTSRRIERINELIKRLVSENILRSLDLDPKIFITITHVETVDNLSEAFIYITVLPEKNSGEILKILNKNIYQLQQILNKQLKMRPVPKIIFKLDKGEIIAGSTRNIFAELEKDRK